MNRFILGIAVCAICLSATAASARTWTDLYGNELNGTFKSFNKNNGMVTITQNGRRIPVRFSGLCRDDRDFIIDDLKKKGREDEVAPYDTEIPDRETLQNQFNREPGAGNPSAGGVRPGLANPVGPGGIDVNEAAPTFPAGSGDGASPAGRQIPGLPATPPGGVPGFNAGGFDGKARLPGTQANVVPQANPFPQAGPPAASSLAGSGIPGADPTLWSSAPAYPAGPAGGKAAGPGMPMSHPGVSGTPPPSGEWTSPADSPWNKSSGSNSAYESGRAMGKVFAYLFMAALAIGIVVWVIRD